MVLHVEKQRLKTVLLEERRISMRAGPEKYAGVVSSISDSPDGYSTACVTLDAGRGFSFPVGSRISVSFTVQSGERTDMYALDALILSCEEDAEQCRLFVSLPDIVARQENRANVRLRVSVGGRLIPQAGMVSGAVGDVPFVSRDLSAGGVRLLCSVPMEVGDSVAIELDLPDAGFPLLDG